MPQLTDIMIRAIAAQGAVRAFAVARNGQCGSSWEYNTLDEATKSAMSECEKIQPGISFALRKTISRQISAPNPSPRQRTSARHS